MTLSTLYNWHISSHRLEQIKRYITIFAILSFIINLGIIVGNNLLDNPPEVLRNAGTNYLTALFTPFSIILFFEVFLLITTIPKSMSRAIARQYEIIALIVIWRVFKDASNFDGVSELVDQTDVLFQIGLDMIVGLLLFLLVTVFYKTLKRGGRDCVADIKEDNPTFIKIKKIITIGLSVILGVLLIFYIGQWIHDIFTVTSMSLFEYQDQFFLSLFTVMIFTDILLVLFSYMFIEDFEIIFRNAAFIISTIFIRLSLTVERPYDLLFAVIALVFGVAINVIYNLYTKTTNGGKAEEVKNSGFTIQK